MASRTPFTLPPEAFLQSRPQFYRGMTPSTAESRSAVTARNSPPPKYNSPFTRPVTASPRTGGAQFTIIANVPYDTVRQDLVSEFRKFGRVELAMVVCDEASRHPHKEWTSTAGYAFVRFSKRTEAAAAIQAATIGLITIRGTRVRADWARKDSYAKRGRVSPAQGAPALGPFGVPDGISLLRDSLNGRSAEGWQMPPQYPIPSSEEPVHWSAPGRNEAVLKALESAFASAFDFVATSNSNSTTTAPEADGGDNIESFGSEPKRIDTTSLECPRPTVTLPSLEHDVTPTLFTSGRPEHLESVLSPVSRNLLAGALSDVTAPEGFFLTDVSPLGGGSTTGQMSARFFSAAFDKSILLPPEEVFEAAVAESRAGREGSDFTTTNPSPACESTASDFSSSEEGMATTELSSSIKRHRSPPAPPFP